MPSINSAIHLSSSNELKQLFSYLEVGITAPEQDFLFAKLLNSNESDSLSLEAFKTFPALELVKFIDSDYKEQWLEHKNLTENFVPDSSDGAQSLVRQQVIYISKQDNDYREHIETFKDGDADAVQVINNALLKHKVEILNQKKQLNLNHADAEKEFLMSEKEAFKKQFDTLDKLYKVIGRVEGGCLNGSEGNGSENHFKKADYSRWAQYLSHEKDDRTVEAISKLKIGLTRSERIEKVEHYTQMAGMVLKILSVALAISAGDFSKAFAETGKDVLEQSHVATESASLLVTGIVLMLKGETKLGLTYIGIGTTMLAAQIATSLSEFGLHMFSAAASTMLLSFVSGACCFAMAGLTQYHISKSDKKIDVLNSKIAEINDVLISKETLTELLESKGKLIPYDEITRQIELWNKPGQRSEVVKDLESIVTLRKQQEKHKEIDSKLKVVEELQDDLIQHEKIILHEEAQKSDLKTSRNLWVSSGVVLIAAGAIAALGLSAATFGILPLVVAALGIGLGVLKYKKSGKNSHAAKLKQSQGDLELYSNLIKGKSALLSQGIDLNKDVDVKCGMFNRSIKINLQDYIRDLIIHNPDKAKNVIEQLNEVKDANTPQEKNSAIKSLKDALGEHDKPKLDLLAYNKDETRGLKLINNLLEFDERVDIDEDGEGEHVSAHL